MAVRVRLFAALREAAGTDVVEVAPAPLAELLAALSERFGEPFSTRLEVASVLVDGDPTPKGADDALRDGAEVALLPPVSGGARRASAP